MEWTQANKLTINTDKTHYVIFSNRNFDAPSLPLITLNNQVLELKTNTKFLGVVLDKTLSFKEHTAYIRSKIAKSIGILFKAKQKLPNSLLKSLYDSFIYSYLSYGIEVWGSACLSHLDPLIKLHKRSIRIISNAHYLAHTAPLFQSLNLIPLRSIYIKQILIFMYKFHNHMLPPHIYDQMFTSIPSIHSHYTRSENQYSIPLVRNNIAK
jgi:hypothetical protein